MFRDTFAVELLLAGVPIDQVSMLLGSQQREDHGEALLAVGTCAAAATGRVRAQGMGRSAGGPHRAASAGFSASELL
jgi:hypothetical protein